MQKKFVQGLLTENEAYIALIRAADKLQHVKPIMRWFDAKEPVASVGMAWQIVRIGFPQKMTMVALPPKHTKSTMETVLVEHEYFFAIKDLEEYGYFGLRYNSTDSSVLCVDSDETRTHLYTELFRVMCSELVRDGWILTEDGNVAKKVVVKKPGRRQDVINIWAIEQLRAGRERSEVEKEYWKKRRDRGDAVDSLADLHESWKKNVLDHL